MKNALFAASMVALVIGAAILLGWAQGPTPVGHIHLGVLSAFDNVNIVEPYACLEDIDEVQFDIVEADWQELSQSWHYKREMDGYIWVYSDDPTVPTLNEYLFKRGIAYSACF